MVCGFDVKTNRCNKTSKTGTEKCKMGNKGRCVNVPKKSPKKSQLMRFTRKKNKSIREPHWKMASVSKGWPKVRNPGIDPISVVLSSNAQIGDVYTFIVTGELTFGLVNNKGDKFGVVIKRNTNKYNIKIEEYIDNSEENEEKGSITRKNTSPVKTEIKIKTANTIEVKIAGARKPVTLSTSGSDLRAFSTISMPAPKPFEPVQFFINGKEL